MQNFLKKFNLRKKKKNLGGGGKTNKGDWIEFGKEIFINEHKYGERYF